MKNVSVFIVALVSILTLGCQTKEQMVAPVTTFEGQLSVSKWGYPKFSNRIGDFQTIETINGDMYVKDFGNSDLAFLKNIKTINGNLEISESEITNLDFLSSLETVNGRISININKNLSSLTGFEKLKKAKGFVLYGNFPTVIPIDLIPIQNIALSETLVLKFLANDTFPFFKNINSLSNALIIEHCKVKNLNCLSNLAVAANIIILRNDLLQNLEGLSRITSVGDIFVGNILLETLKGLDNLKTVTGMFNISSIALKSVSNLRSVSSVESLVLSDTKCDNLDGLENLLACKKLLIYNNLQLANLCALKPLVIADNAVEWRVFGNSQNPTIKDIKINCQ